MSKDNIQVEIKIDTRKLFLLKIKRGLMILMMLIFFGAGFGLIGNSYLLIFSGSTLTSLMFLVGGLLLFAVGFKIYDLRVT